MDGNNDRFKLLLFSILVKALAKALSSATVLLSYTRHFTQGFLLASSSHQGWQGPYF
jgi:hypothetical protein